MRLRYLTPAARAFFAIMLGIFVALALIAAIEGWWFHALASALLAVLFVASAPFVLAWGWKPRPTRPTRRPVTRRRR